MRRITRIAIAMLVGLLFLTAANAPVLAQEDDGRFFPQTGHWVNQPFLSFYDASFHADYLLGYPITPAFIDNAVGATQGKLIQYFQKARMEYHPERPIGQQVVLTPLGTIFRQVQGPGEVIEDSNSNPACRLAVTWDFPICYNFFEFYMGNGAEDAFGEPISPLEVHGGRLVQYFENTRLEWHPENPEGAQVNVPILGLAYFYLRGENFNLLRPTGDNIFRMQVDKLAVRAFVSQALVSNGDEQGIYVIVRNQNNVPIENAQVTITVEFTGGQPITLANVYTDDNGLASANIVVNNAGLGMATVSIQVVFGETVKIMQTSFRVWY